MLTDTHDTMDEDIYRKVLQQYWGYDDFRGIQRQIVESISSGRDTLGLMPTGGGKSICFQVPALAKGGITIVVTPLIALMKDQVRNLRDRGIKAEAIHAGLSRDDIVRILDNCILSGDTFLYLSPERLASPLFISKLERMASQVSYLVVDEAHCISQWGYDFRPAYLNICAVRQLLPPTVPVLALTATAPPKVVDDIQERLSFRERNVISMSFERKNLIYVVRKSDHKLEEIAHILTSVPEGSAIVYVRTRVLTSEIAHYLNEHGITAMAYHAGLTTAEKDFRQANWTSNRVRVMVATNAFGMGIDNPGVRVVIHYTMPDSIEAYFQEAGRAGRDGRASYAVLLYDDQDIYSIRMRESNTYPTPEYIRQTYENLSCFFQIGEGEAQGHTFMFPMHTFCHVFKQYPVQTNSALKILSNAGYIEYHEQYEFQSSVRFILTKAELNRLNETDANTDAVIQSLFRTYTGLFSEYVYIEETYVSHDTGLSNDTVYNILKSLRERHIIDYIPRRVTPIVTYTQPRVEASRIVLLPSVYEERKQGFHSRINYVTQYVTSTKYCRSRMLLYYFGQHTTEGCGQCDVCLEQKKKAADIKKRQADIAQAILQVLSDGKPHEMSEIYSLSIDYSHDVVNEAMRYLKGEELIEVNLTTAQLSNPNK